MKRVKGITLENENRRHGPICAECGKMLGKYRLDGQHNGKSISFCSFKCHDEYMDKQESQDG